MASNFKRYYNIGGVAFSVETPVPFEDKEPYSLFSVGECQVDSEYVYSFCDTLPEPVGELLYEEANYRAYEAGENIVRYGGFFKDGRRLDPEYALTVYPKSGDMSRVSVTIPLDRDLPMKAAFIYRSLCIEHLLLRYRGIILHSSFVETDKGAILFTAPSGTGKSTQAELWRRCRDAFVVNGDCTYVRIKDGAVTANGLPFSGTSGICHNKSIPVRAIVYLTQAPENHIERLSGAGAFRVLYEGSKYDRWHDADASLGMDVISDIVLKVPMFRLDCVPDESAVKILEDELLQTDCMGES